MRARRGGGPMRAGRGGMTDGGRFRQSRRGDGRSSRKKGKGGLSKGEEFIGKVFQRMDADGNGFVTRAEFLAKSKKSGESFDDEFDKNGDGKLTKAELIEAMGERFVPH
jgi:hypothetical protein